ncbi:hypothetical protein MMC13_001992 [Lambiella insularis]|nr:hypothetical protein [Lambiella insularis]
MTPFEIEMRRRLWWQVCLVDSRSEDVQVSQFKLSEEMFDNKMPAQTDDANHDPAMSDPPAITDRWSDMTVFLIRCEVWKLSHRLRSITATNQSLSSDIDERLRLFQQSQARIDDIYLKHFDPDQPLHSFVATTVRLFLTKVDLILHSNQHATRTKGAQLADPSQSDKLFMWSLSIIEYTRLIQNEPSWSGWRWQIQDRQPPWHALRVVLSELCTRRWGPICERAWLSAKQCFDSLPEIAQRDPRYQKLLMLTSDVQRDRAEDLYHQVLGLSNNVDVDQTSTAPSALSAHLARSSINGTTLTWVPPETFLPGPNGSYNNTPGDVTSPGMDWQFWGGFAGEMEPISDLWSISDL